MGDAKSWGPTTITTVVIAIIVVLVGGIAVITDDLTFEKYLAAVVGFSVGNGLLGIGRGYYKGQTETKSPSN